MENCHIVTEKVLCFLVKDNKILLSKKITGGMIENRYNGYSGSVLSGETPRSAAVRKIKEQGGVHARESDLDKRAIVDFYYPHAGHDNRRVFVFFVKEWMGDPKETDARTEPEEFDFNDIPYDYMAVSVDKEWLPQVLKGKKLKAEFVFNKDVDVVEKRMDIIKEFDNTAYA
ncbi:MAG TPA: NUDIX domain-containing protein [Alphaproteobacteria bacterium]|nr:NUDIX domain-containing protein [Alphaproteobacteria bacterium]